MNNVLIKYFPEKIKRVLEENIDKEYLEEIRIRNNKPIIIKFDSNIEKIVPLVAEYIRHFYNK